MHNKIRKLRKERELSQENMAFKLGISQKAYSELENGKVCLTQDKIDKLAKVFNVCPSSFCLLSCECNNTNTVKLKELKQYIQNLGIPLPDFLK